MGRPKKSDKSKEKPAQVEDAGRAEGEGAEDQVVKRNLILTDDNAENVNNAEAGSSGLQNNRKSQSHTDLVTDSSMENARMRLQRRKRARIVRRQQQGRVVFQGEERQRER